MSMITIIDVAMFTLFDGLTGSVRWMIGYPNTRRYYC